MKAVGRNLIIQKIEEVITKSEGGLLLTKNDRNDIRYIEAYIISVGEEVVGLKEKQDRVEDAICATKAAIKEGIVSGGGIALLNAAMNINENNVGEKVLSRAILAPFKVILDNAGLEQKTIPSTIGKGIDVVTGNMVHMIKEGIIDPLLVTKSALTNAASVATTILSTDCVINNIRVDESSR